MLILFDNRTPRGLARFLTGHRVEEARRQGWEELANGELIGVAEQAGFEVMVTTDKNIKYQQNLKARKIALVVLEHSQWPMVKLVAETVVVAVNAVEPAATWKSAYRSRNKPRRVALQPEAPPRIVVTPFAAPPCLGKGKALKHRPPLSL